MKNVRISDHRKAVGAAGIGRFEQPAAGASHRVVHVHVHLANDDLLFLLHLLRWQRGVLHDVTEDIDRHLGAGVRHVDVVHRAVERGVGVHVAARFLHLLVDPAARAGGGPLEQHVFEHVG
jgi:hypothetical protein